MFGSLALLGVLWVLSPLALIPLVIIFYNQNTVLKRKLREQEEIRKSPYMQPPIQSRPVQPSVQSQPVQPLVQPQPVQPTAYTVQPQPVQPTTYTVQPQQADIQPVVKPKKKIHTMNVVFLIGVIFIVVAGMIFATTTWNILPGFAKAAIIALLIVFFFGVSVFSRKKLLLKQTGLTFYSLGSLFIPLAFLGAGYFELLGQYLSVQGDGKYLLSLFASVCLTAACGFGIRIYQSKLFIWTTYLAVTGIFVSGIWQLLREADIRVLALAVYCLVVIFLTKIIKNRDNMFLSMFLYYARILLLLTGIYICFNGEMTLIYAASTAVYTVTLVVFSCERQENVFTKIAAFLVPWSTLFTFISFVLAIYPDSESNVFLIYYLFITLFTVLAMLLPRKNSRLKRFVFPFSIMVWTLGVLMGCYEYFAMQEGYAQVYAWLLTLYAITALYLKMIELRESAVEVESRLHQHNHCLAQVWMYVLAVMATLSLYVTSSQLFADWTVAECLSVPMGAAAAILMIYLIPAVYCKINIMKRESGQMLFTLVYALSIVTVLCWCCEYRPGYWTGIIAISAAIICQWGVRQRGNSITGFLSMIFFWIPVYRLIGMTGFNYDIQQVILTVVFLCTLVIGRLLYHSVLKTEKGESRYVCLLDWISISAVCVPVGLFFGDEIWRFISVFLLILYTLNFVKRVHQNSHRPIYSVAVMLLCVAWWVQPFFALPEAFESLINIIPFLLAVAFLYKIVWRGQERIMYWVMYAAIICGFVRQFCSFTLFEDLYASVDLTHMIRYIIFIIGVLLVTVWAFYKKSLSYSILSQVLLILSIFDYAVNMVSDEVAVNVLLYTCILLLMLEAALCMWTLYRLRMMWSGVVPAAVVLLIIGKRLDDMNIAYDLGENFGRIVWILVFLCMLLLSYILHHKRKVVCIVPPKGALIDWCGIMSVISTIILLKSPANEIWHFIGLLMLAVYVVRFYHRIHQSMDRILLSITVFIICVMWWTQPFFLVPLELQSEYRMLPLILLSLCLYKWIWRGCEKVFTWVYYVTIVICMFWQGVDAIRSRILSDVLILGIAALVILVISFWIKSKRWFLLACITLAALLLYMTRTFWLSLAWWIYLLAAGVILITLASVNEYYKKKGEQRESRFKRLMQEWEW